jgi:hypothetical protein
LKIKSGTQLAVIARSDSDEAIHSFFLLRDGLLRRLAPRNDGRKAIIFPLFEI